MRIQPIDWTKPHVPIEKIRDYLLNPLHEKGVDKAVVFALFGFSLAEAEDLRRLIISSLASSEPKYLNTTDYGERYQAILPIDYAGKRLWLKTGWLVRNNEDFPRFVTAYPYKLKP